MSSSLVLEKPAMTEPTESEAAETPVEPTERSLMSYIGFAVSLAVLVLLAALAILVVALPAIVHGTPLTVLTNSMAPKFPPGTLIVMKPATPAEVHVGDVLTYQIKSGDPAVISHRVIERDVASDGTVTFITKGDNNSLPDPRVLPVQVKGTLWYAIPYLGWVNNLVSGPNRAVIVPILAGLLFAYAAYTVVASVIERRRRAREKKLAATVN
jgi:signal peptidase